MSFNKEELLDFACKVALAAGDCTLKYFKKKVEIISKKDNSPVTIADREAELLMRKMIEEKFPEHGILGEEFGHHNETAAVQWILDPIDGTVGFIHGIPLYTNLIGVTVDNVPVAGVINAPYMSEMIYAANGTGAFLNGSKTTVRHTINIENACLKDSGFQYFN
jgi:histidinol-phosphatase